MDTRRLKLLPLAKYKLRYLAHWLLDRKDWRNARSYIWATLFSRDAGLALQDTLYRLFPLLGPYPRQLEIEVTTACNLKCTICEHTYWTEKPSHMSFDEFKRIIDQFPGLRWVGMTGIGSGFLNPEYMRMLRFLKEEKRSFVEFFDHFYLLDEATSTELIRMGINKIWVSLESAHKESYNKIRVGSDFDTVIRNLQSMMRAKRVMKSPIPELWFHFIINKHNVDEMEDYVDLVADLAKEERGLSVPIIYWTNLLPFEEVEALVARPERSRMLEIERLCRDRGIFSVVNENVACDKPMSSCTKWNEPFVLVTGHLQPCCALNEANDRRYQEEHAFLNILEVDFKRWWHSDAKWEFIANLKQGKVNPVCKNCHIFKHPDAEESVSIRDYERRKARSGEKG
ncbi:MAG: radical SAM protein [Desulfomonile tiedjei]|nr:radical SAM protein [Desulfomonile tiedjei]